MGGWVGSIVYSWGMGGLTRASRHALAASDMARMVTYVSRKSAGSSRAAAAAAVAGDDGESSWHGWAGAARRAMAPHASLTTCERASASCAA